MLFIKVATLLFPVAIMAAPAGKPAGKPAAGDEKCLPVSYILTEYTMSKSPSYIYVSFNVQSSYTRDAQVDDLVTAGANCEADGAEIPSSDNECNIAGLNVDNLVFDLKNGSSDASYRIHHKWQCNGATWTSTNDIDLPPLDCNTVDDDTNDGATKCTAMPVSFAPQNTRKLTDDDSKKAAGKGKAAKPTTHPTAKSSTCSTCSPAPLTL